LGNQDFTQFRISIAIFQIYNNKIHDLMNKNDILEISDLKGVVTITNLKWTLAKTSKEVIFFHHFPFFLFFFFIFLGKILC
jgi:hypothetical protein